MEKKNIINYFDIANYLSPESIGIIWNEIDSKPNNKNKQPTDNSSNITNFIEVKKLPKLFYPFYNDSNELMFVLQKCPLYKDIQTKFAEYAENSQDVEPKEEYKFALLDLYSKIQLIMPKFIKC